MAVNLVIDHAVGDVKGWLAGAFGDPDNEALGNTVAGRPVQGNPRYQAWSWPDYTVVVYSPSSATLNVNVESTSSIDVRTASETTWRALVKTAKWRQTNLRSASLDDGTSGRILANGQTGFRHHFGRAESSIAIGTAVATGIWLALALPLIGVSSDIVLGALPTLVAGVVVAVRATMYAGQKRLIWEMSE